MKIEPIELSGGDYFTHYLCIDDEIDIKSGIHNKSLYPSEESLKKLENVTLNELGEQFTDISYSTKTDWSTWEFAIKIVLSKEVPGYLENYDPEPPFLFAACNIDYINWNRHYSIHQLKDAFDEVLSSRKEAEFYYHPLGEGIFGVVIRADVPDITLEEITNKAMDITEPIQKEALKLVSSKVAPDFITTIFEFPEEFKTACKQYLVYFGQFLADIGIKANTEIKENANRVLFTVIPDNAAIALDNIKKALQVYMEAPDFKSINKLILESDNKDAAIKQWESNIHFLRSQLALAQALLQTKDATIGALNFSNYLLNQVVSNHNQARLTYNPSNDEEPIVGSFVAVNKYNGPGFSINLPEILRVLKRILGL